MDGINEFVNIKKYSEMNKEEKLDAFESLQGNIFSVAETDTVLDEDGKYKQVGVHRDYCIIQEQDFEKDWDFFELKKEMEDLAEIEAEKKYKDQNTAEEQAASYAKRYKSMSEKDRKKAFKKYRELMNDKMDKLTKAYTKRKKGRTNNKISVKTLISYEKEIIELNAQARDQYLEATQTDQKGRLDFDKVCNRMRKNYRLLRMYLKHINSGRMSAKDKKNIKADYNKVLRELRADETYMRNIDSDLRKEFTFRKATGIYSLEERRSDYEVRQLKAAYKDEREEKEAEEAYLKELKRQRGMTEEERIREIQEAKEKADELIANAQKEKEKQRKEQEKLLKKRKKEQDEAELKARKKEEARIKKEREKAQRKAGQLRAAWSKFLRTGNWDPNAKALKESEAAPKEEVKEGWGLGEALGTAEQFLSQDAFDSISNAQFVAIAEKLNENYKNNWQKFKDEYKEKDLGKRLRDDMTGVMNRFTPKEQRQAVQQKINRYSKLLGLNFPEVDNALFELYRKMFSREESNIYPDGMGVNFFAFSSAEIMSKLSDEDFKKLDKFSAHLETLEDKLLLRARGERIFKSAVIKDLIVSDKLDDPNAIDEIVRHVNGIDHVIRRMAVKKFGPLAGEASYIGLREFLGEKALFGDYRLVRDLSERYLNGLSLTNIEAARLDQDFKSVFADVFDDPFYEDYREVVEQYLAKSGLRSEIRGAKENTRSIMKKYMKPLVAIFGQYKAAVTGLEASAATWELVRKRFEVIILRSAGAPLKSSDDELKSFGKSVTDLIQKENAKEKEGTGKLTYNNWEKLKKEAARPENTYSDVDEFSYKGLLMGEQLMESKEVKELIKDDKIRRFISENLDSVIINNTALKERFPALKDIKNLDDLDAMSFGEFAKMVDVIKYNLEKNKAGLKKLLDEGSLGDERIEQMRRCVLLDMMRGKVEVKDVSSMLRAQLKEHEDKEELKRHRMQYLIGRQSLKRDGRVKYRFEDMKDRDKSILQDYFGKGKKWLGERVSRMDQASFAWRRLESRSPEAVAQVKKWIKEAYRDNDKESVESKLGRLAKAIKEGPEALKKAGFELDDHLINLYQIRNNGADGLYTTIREALTCKRSVPGKDGKIVEKDIDLVSEYGESQMDVKAADPAKYMLELSLCDAQDKMYSHGCIRQGAMFEHYGDDKAYRKMMENDARYIHQRLDIMDRYLNTPKYDANPELKMQLRDKLMEIFLTAESKEHQDQISRMTKLRSAKEIEEELRQKYEKDVKEFEEGIKKAYEEVDNQKALAEEVTEKINNRRLATEALADEVKDNREDYYKKRAAYDNEKLVYAAAKDAYDKSKARIKAVDTVAECNAQIKNLTKGIQDKQKRFDKLQAKLAPYDNLKKPSKKVVVEVVGKDNKTEKKNVKNENYESELKQYEAAAKHTKTKEYKSEKNERDSLKKSLDSDKKLLEDLESKKAASQKILDDMSAQLKEKENILDEKQKLSDDIARYAKEREKVFKGAKEELEYLKRTYDEANDRVTMIGAQVKVLEAEKNNVEKKIQDELKEIESQQGKAASLMKEISGNMSKLAEEYGKNSLLCGYDNLDQMTHHLTDCIDADGKLKNDVQSSVTLFEERRKMLEEYGDGSLAIFWEAFINDDQILSDLIGAEEFLARERIEKLYDDYAPLARALNQQYTFVSKKFIEEKFPILLKYGGQTEDKKGEPEWHKTLSKELEEVRRKAPEEEEAEKAAYEEDLKSIEKSKETEEEKENQKRERINSHNKKMERIKNAQEEFWKKQLQSYTDDYFSKTLQGTKSIDQVLYSACGDAQTEIAKHMMYEDEDVKKQFKTRTAKYRKWWFRTSKNTGVELVAQKHKQTKYQISMKNAMDVIYAMQYVILADDTEAQQLVNNDVAKKMYAKYTQRYLANDEKAEMTFLKYILEAEHEIKVDEDEGAIENAIGGLSEEDQKDIEQLLTQFRRHVRGKCVELDVTGFNKVIGNYAKEFLEKKRSEQEAFEVDQEMLKQAMEAKIEESRKDQNEVMQQKYRGRTLMNKLLFGGKQSELTEFGQKKQTLVYTPEKAKLNKKVKSKGEEKDEELLKEAQKYFEKDENGKKVEEGEYSDILAECLDEYCRVNHRYYQRIGRLGDKVAGWFVDGVDDDIKMEANRLKIISRVAKSEKGVPEDARDLFIVYAAKFSREGVFTPEAIEKLASEFMPYYNKLKEAEAIEVRDPALKRLLADACEKNRAYLFLYGSDRGSTEDVKTFRDMIDAQKAYFVYADKAYEVIDNAMMENRTIKRLPEDDQQRYRTSLREYFTEKILNDSTNGVELKEEELRQEVIKRVEDGKTRNALMLQGEKISNEEYEQQMMGTGVVTRKDFEHALFATRKTELVKKYKALNDNDRSLLVLSLYCSKIRQRGSQSVVYGNKPEIFKSDREQILRYMKGEKVDFKPDYNRAIRALSTRSKNFKISGDTKLFREALEFVEMVNKRREMLRVKDYSRMSDSMKNAKDADTFRKKKAQEVAGLKTGYSLMKDIKIESKQDFFECLRKQSLEDTNTQISQGLISKGFRKLSDWKENTSVKKVMARFNKMSEGEKSLLIYVLQDRTALDYSSAGKDEKTKIVPHANAEKRFELYEKLMTEDGKLDALSRSADEMLIRNAMKSLYSFQVKDNKELPAGELGEDDFVEENLYRAEALDWDLLAHAMDFIDEIKRDQRKMLAVRQANKQVKNPSDANKDSKAVQFYHDNKNLHDIVSAHTLEDLDTIVERAYFLDKNDATGVFSDGAEIDDMMTGYYSLSPQEKLLFVKCLQHRDILDVSQKNLYWNFFGRAERDFVNPKERDELIDEFLEKNASGEGIELGNATYQEAILSLLSTQVNDDMKFENMEGSDWAYKNLNVNNQLLVTDQRKATRFDWKLFERALQFVTRTVRERKTADYDESLYKAVAQKDKNAKLKMDRSYMRKNLHHTGSRFMRFLAKEGYTQIEDKLGLFEKAVDFGGFLVSTKTANYLHEQVNKLKPEEKAAEDNNDDDDDDNEEEEEKVPLLQSLAGMVMDAKEQYDSLQEMKDQFKDTYKEYKGIFIEEEEEKEEPADELAKEMKEVEKPLKGKPILEMVMGFASSLPDYKDKADKFIKDNPDKLEMADKYLKKVFGEKLTATKAAGWYESARDWTMDKRDSLADVILNDHLGDDNAMKQFLDGLVEKAGAVTGFMESVSKYVSPAIDMIGEFKNIVQAGVNRHKLNKAKAEGVEAASEDRKMVEEVKKAGQFSEDDLKEVEEGSKDRLALLNANNSMTKSIQGRKIIESLGELTKKGLNIAKLKGYDKIVGVAVDLANFFYKCMSDKDALMEYYSSGGAGEVSRIMEGRRKLNSFTSTRNIKKQPKELALYPDVSGGYQIKTGQLDMLQRALGFERREEFADYLRLNMVNSLLFSASDNNPLKQPKILAEVALAVLGLEDLIGKTDAESAQKIFEKLKD